MSSLSSYSFEASSPTLLFKVRVGVLFVSFVYVVMNVCTVCVLSFTSKRAVSPNPYLDNPVNGYACPTGVALHYDDVPCINGSVCNFTNFKSIKFLPSFLILPNSSPFLTLPNSSLLITFLLLARLRYGKVPDAHYSTPASGDRRWKEESHYENTDLYENMPSPKLAARYSPKSIRPSSSTGHYNTPLSTKSLSSSSSPSAANTNTTQVTNPGLVMHLSFRTSKLFI